MESILILLIVLIIMFILGVDTGIIIGTVLAAAGLLLVGMFLLFAVSGIIMAGSEKTTAHFSGIDKSPLGRFDCAYYSIDGKEYPNAFPSEPVMKDKLYPADRELSVRFFRKKGYVFDKTAGVIIIVGIIGCTALLTIICGALLGGVI